MFQPNRLYDKYIYVQTMKSPKHDLSRNVSKTTKAQAYNIRHDSFNVKEHLSFDLAHEMVYAFQDFHLHPHGSGLWSEKRLDDKHFRFFGCGGSGAVTKHISKKCLFDYSHEKVKVAYPGSDDLKPFQNIHINRSGLLRAALAHGECTPVRDNNREGTGTAKRLTLGFTRVQGGNSERTEYHNGLPKPFLSMDKLGLLTAGVRLDLSKILTRGQLFLDKVYASPYSDPSRTHLFGCPMARYFSPHCLSRFEFVDVFVESNATLNRHMDYQNDPMTGYNCGVSYSYVIYHLSGLYRVNVIMASRAYCGNFMSNQSGT